MIASELNINLIIAKECLLMIERRSLLARDQTLEGLYFYSNLLLNV
jgi:hypothetical protein